MGYDEDKIAQIGTDHEDVELETDPEILARFEQYRRRQENHAHGYIDQVREVLVYESYINLDPDATTQPVFTGCKSWQPDTGNGEVDR